MQQKSDIINDFKTSDNDTGSSEVQIALLTNRITHLTAHLKSHPKDFHTRRGMVALTNRRRKLLNYLKKHKLDTYKSIIERLKLRR